MPASSYQQQKLRVCEVCSAYLGIHDNDRRLADHFGGKLHLGFITIREKLDELKVHFKLRILVIILTCTVIAIALILPRSGTVNLFPFVCQIFSKEYFKSP